jgi:formate-dependent nitrite reductase membrane component NrfD
MNLSEMAWGITLWFDLWAVGIASASFMAAFLINKLSGGTQRNLFRLAVYSGIVFALIGVTLLLSHLGHILWFWHMFVIVRPESVLSLGGWILSGWLTVAGVTAVLWIAKYFCNYIKSEGNKSVLLELADKLTGILSWVGLVFSILLITYGGVLIATTSQPLWANTLLLPSLFIGSAMCTGLSWLILASFIANWATGMRWLGGILKILFGSADWKIDSETINKLARTLIITLAVTLIILIAFVLWLYGAAPDAVSVLVSGEMAGYFWAGLVGFGLVLPFLMLLLTWKRRANNFNTKALVIASSFMAFAGGLILRAVILIGGQL